MYSVPRYIAIIHQSDVSPPLCFLLCFQVIYIAVTSAIKQNVIFLSTQGCATVVRPPLNFGEADFFFLHQPSNHFPSHPIVIRTIKPESGAVPMLDMALVAPTIRRTRLLRRIRRRWSGRGAIAGMGAAEPKTQAVARSRRGGER